MRRTYSIHNYVALSFSYITFNNLIFFSFNRPDYFENLADLVRLTLEFKSPSESFSSYQELFTKMVSHKNEHIRNAGVYAVNYTINYFVLTLYLKL